MASQPATRVSFLFTDSAGAYAAGWSENYWHAGTPVDALAAALEIRKKVLYVHASGVSMTHIRCTPFEQDNRPITYELQPHEFAVGDGDEWQPDYVKTALLIERRQESTNERTRNWIRGIPDLASVNNLYTPTDNYKKDVDALLKVLTSDPWKMYMVPRGQTGKSITAIDTLTGVFTVPVHLYAPGQKIRIRRGRGVLDLAGLWEIADVPTGNTFRVRGWYPAYHPGVYVPRSAKTYHTDKVIVSPNKGEVVRITSHATGIGYSAMVGRRRARR